MGFCDDCPARQYCQSPCDRLEAKLESEEKGRMADIKPAGRELADGMTELAQRLSPREQAMVLLYYRGGFSFRRIGKAFGLHRSTVHRLFKQLRRNVIETTDLVGTHGKKT